MKITDVALWDIGGKAAGLPIHKLLGGYRDRVPAYASSMVLPSKQAYAEEALAYRQAGWTAYKIHPPTRWRQDIEVCRAVRDAVGPDYTLMLDSTWSYTYEPACAASAGPRRRDRLRSHRAQQAGGAELNSDPVDCFASLDCLYH